MAHHVTPEERDRIAHLQAQDRDQKEIALALGRHPSTISREVKRNGTQGDYLPCQAQRKAVERRRQRPLVRKMDRPEISVAARQGLASLHSPDQISHAMRLRPDVTVRESVSGSSIYRWIKNQGEDRAHWESFLRRRGKRPCRRKKAAKSLGAGALANRPQEINDRIRLGDLEGDLVLGRPGTGGLLTLVDRRSRYTFIAKVTCKQAQHVRKKARQTLRDLPPQLRRSITLDNGTEFALFETLEKSLGLSIYWCEPGCPYQRGTNENTNGLIRQFFPKGTDFRDVSHQEVKEAQKLLNGRPRACLGYRAPTDVFFGKPP